MLCFEWQLGILGMLVLMSFDILNGRSNHEQPERYCNALYYNESVLFGYQLVH
jgi:hypothetical protein